MEFNLTFEVNQNFLYKDCSTGKYWHANQQEEALHLVVVSQFLFSVFFCSDPSFPHALLQVLAGGMQLSVRSCAVIMINGCTVKNAVNIMNMYAITFIHTKVENSRQQQNRSTTNA
ncbi:MAG: hypothetical protein ACOYVG_03320 [Bacteroidota bacterium]